MRNGMTCRHLDYGRLKPSLDMARWAAGGIIRLRGRFGSSRRHLDRGADGVRSTVRSMIEPTAFSPRTPLMRLSSACGATCQDRDSSAGEDTERLMLAVWYERQGADRGAAGRRISSRYRIASPAQGEVRKCELHRSEPGRHQECVPLEPPCCRLRPGIMRSGDASRVRLTLPG